MNEVKKFSEVRKKQLIMDLWIIAIILQMGKLIYILQTAIFGICGKYLLS